MYYVIKKILISFKLLEFLKRFVFCSYIVIKLEFDNKKIFNIFMVCKLIKY